jgi:hypothetical protein
LNLISFFYFLQNQGPGDITNLWTALSAGYGSASERMRNALRPNSPNRWLRYSNDRQQYIIPYVITGKFGAPFLL